MNFRGILPWAGRSIHLLIIACLLPVAGISQEKAKKIEIINADALEYNQNINPNVRRFIGNVIFEHNNFTMYCDSAYFYNKENKIDAFSNVHIEKGDTLHTYGDFLSYNGNTNFGKIRRNVKLIDPQAKLLTDSMDFYTEQNYAYYFDGGQIISEDKTISSITGHYYSNENMAYFKDSVVVESPDYTVKADTLNYHTEKEIAYFMGPTHIYSDSSYLYCEKGWYKTQSNQFLFTENALYQKEDRIVKGDTLFFDEPKGYGRIKQNAEIIDTSRKITLKGHYSEYTEDPNTAFLTDSALMTQVDSNKDTLFLHADTLKSQYDSTGKHRIFKAFNNVRFFKTDIQGKCDSLAYSLQDSVMEMHYEPVIWADSNQIYAEFLTIKMKDDEVHRFYLHNTAFIVSEEGLNNYNQITGKKMVGYVQNNNIYRVDVDGNAETVYYTKDKNEIVGVNKAVSSNLLIRLKDNEVVQINFLNSPDGTLYPLGDLKETKLKGFKWLEKERPRSKQDIFRKN